MLVGYLAVQAACADAGLPLPLIGELDAQRCERELDHWRLDLSRPDATGYLHHRCPGTPELALAATARVTEHATASVVVVSQRDVADAGVADLDRAVSVVRRYQREQEPEGDE